MKTIIEIDHDAEIGITITKIPGPGPDPDPDPVPGDIDPVDQSYQQVSLTAKDQTARRAFVGFGYSFTVDSPYAKLTQAQRSAVDPALFRDLDTRIVRLWHRPGDPERTINAFGKTGIVEACLKNGVSEVLLAPEGYTPGKPAEYARRLWEDIEAMTRAGVLITATGTQNEPGADKRADIPDVDMIPLYRAMGSERQRRGLMGIDILAPEYPSCDSRPKNFFDRVKGDVQAMAAIDGAGWHSNNMALDSSLAARWIGVGKDLWQTEASEGNIDGDQSQNWHMGSKAAARFLNDLNQGCTHWVWFIGYGDGSQDTGQKLIIGTGGNSFRKNATYRYMQHITSVVPVGTKFTRLTSNLKNHTDLVWTYGMKTPICAAFGKRLLDGRAVILLANSSAGAGQNDGDYNDWWKATPFQATVDLPGMGSGKKVFDVMASGPGGVMAPRGTTTMVAGVVRLKAKPGELVSLVERP